MEDLKMPDGQNLYLIKSKTEIFIFISNYFRGFIEMFTCTKTLGVPFDSTLKLDKQINVSCFLP